VAKKVPDNEVFEVDVNGTPMTIVCGRVTSSGNGALVLSIDELFEEDEEHSVLAIVRDGRLFGVAVEECCCAVSELIGVPTGHVFLGDGGGIWTANSEGFSEVTGELKTIDLKGPLRDLGVGSTGELIAVGAALQAYATSNLIDWADLNVPAPPTIEEIARHGLESYSSFADQESYAVGWRGDVFKYESHLWSKLDLSTNLDLYAVSCALDGWVYICGDEGLIFKGRNESWQCIENDLTDEKLWDVAHIQGRTFVASDRLLYEIADNRLILASYTNDDHVPTLTHSLSAVGDIMWSIGSKQLFEFRDNSWSELVSMR
jgi:hypothetical protein